eukprot:TRINITY_DN3130_c0_g2_i2.p1 TRINITY_DN3130_c0_g2~~TRINITY_DN3130_c0_g2_i2.p1  ORF type:complete len:343 (+),score=41.62 TRINITY_DN3130_c0_g2_i2:128-1156(+)
MLASASIRCLQARKFLLPTLRLQINRNHQVRKLTVMAALKLDSHLHVWAAKEEIDKFPYSDAVMSATSAADEPPLPGNVEVLLPQMETAGVSGCLIVQPANHLFDHSYVTSVLQRYPDKFVGCLLADPTEDGGGAEELERLVKEEGYKAVRFNPYLWPEGGKMTNEVGKKMYAKAGELGVPVGYMTFQGFLYHADEIEELIKEIPQTKVIIDHLGFCKAKNPNSEEWQRLLSFAQYPQVYVKLSAFFRISRDDPPYKDYVPTYSDVIPCVKQLLKEFGAKRLMWGTDFPWISEQCGYVRAWDLLDVWDEIEGEPLMSEEDKEWVLGKTLASLFPDSFGQKVD